MARQKSELLSVDGINFQILKAIIDPVLGLGGNDENVKRLLKDDKLCRKIAELIMAKHVINCDVDPFVPAGWKVESHKKTGIFKWDISSIKLYLSENQQGNKSIEGNKLRKELEKEPVLNANVLDYLLKHPELIPEEWKGKAIFFWGTIYRDSYGDLYVRGLSWGGDHWGWSCRWLDDDFYRNGPAACSQVSN